MSMFVERGFYTGQQFRDQALRAHDHGIISPDEKLTQAYLSGPMRGYPRYNREAFDQVAQVIHQLGLVVYNPPAMEEEHDLTAAQYLRDDLTRIAESDVMVLLPDWRRSEGAILEAHIALHIEMPLFVWQPPGRLLPDLEHDFLFRQLGYAPRLGALDAS